MPQQEKLTEAQIQARMTEIANEYAGLKQFDRFSLTMEAIGDTGNVSVLLKCTKPIEIYKRVINYNEPLDFISDTFDYPDTFTPRSKDIALDGVEMAYFDQNGYLIVSRGEKGYEGEERFKVQKKHRDRVKEILKQKLGGLFKG